MKTDGIFDTVFLDRDGVINQEVGVIRQPSDLQLIPGSAPAIAMLNRAGIRAIVATNQPVVARGLCWSCTIAKRYRRAGAL